MAQEANKRMDELLKAYADKRRQDAGSPFELHPATRKLLQGEVARVYAKTPVPSRWHRLLLYWPRIAFASACLVITLTLVLLVLPRQTMMQMAQRPPESLLRDAPAEAKDKELFSDGIAAPAPPSSTAPVTAGREFDLFAKRDELETLEARKDADSEKAKRMLEESVGEKNENIAERRMYRLSRTAETSSARYVQQKLAEKPDTRLGVRPQAAEPARAAQPVLNSFQFEQSGDKVRLIDEDGSVYSGNLLPESELKKESQLSIVGQAGAAPAGGVQQVHYFRAAGTNRSLRQPVSIEANISQLQTNVLPGLAPSAPANQPAKPQQLQLQTIRGRARVGANQEFQIEAVPEKP